MAATAQCHSTAAWYRWDIPIPISLETLQYGFLVSITYFLQFCNGYDPKKRKQKDGENNRNRIAKLEEIGYYKKEVVLCMTTGIKAPVALFST